MSDETLATPALPVSEAADRAPTEPAPGSDAGAEEPGEAAREVQQAPMGFVHLGTGTARSRQLYEERYRQAEARRAEAERDRAEAQNQVNVRHEDAAGEQAITKLPGRPGGAVQYTTQFTAHPEVPKAYLKFYYLDRRGEKTGIECLVDLIVGANPERPTELCIVIVCPSCQEHTHKHQQDNQLRIFQSNKYFDFVAAAGPSTFEFRDPVTGEVGIYNSAGLVRESEPFSCPDCGWRARIINNCVRPG